MKNKGPFYDQIEAFLTGRLTPAEQDAMRKALLDDPELAREVELRRLEFDVSESLIAENIRQQMQGLRREPPTESPPEKKNLVVLLLIAAVLLITAIGVYRRQQRAPEPPPAPATSPPNPATDSVPAAPQATYPPAHDNKPAPAGQQNRYLALAAELYQNPDFETLRGPASGAADPLETALAAWQKQDYAAVVTALQPVSATNPQYWRAMTLTAHAQFKLKRFGQAAQTFTAIADGKIQPWAEDADGYVLLAMLADGQSDTAAFRARLEKVLADPGHPWFDLAGKIQSRLPK